MVWKTSADHAVPELSRKDREEAYRYFSAEHVKVKQRAKEIQGTRTTQWCWRSYREQRPHTVVLKASADHAVAEFQRQKTVLRVSATPRCCKLPDRGVREHLPRTDDHAVAQHYVVVLEVPGRSRSGKIATMWHWRKGESHRHKHSFQQKCYNVELDRTCDEQLDGC